MAKIFAANWKLFKTPDEATAFFKEFSPMAKQCQGTMIFFPTSVCLPAAALELKNSQIGWGPQNVWCEAQGAFTGETSASTVKKMGATHALVGHSERRKVFGENDELLAKKVAFIQSQDLIPVFCIGETLEEREAGKTNQVNASQLENGLSLLDKTKKIIVAYEPVWAIGTGKVATPEQVAEAHAYVRSKLDQMGLQGTPILYGGSVKPDNAKALGDIANVDGFLVGGASLEVKSFLGICQA